MTDCRLAVMPRFLRGVHSILPFIIPFSKYAQLERSIWPLAYPDKNEEEKKNRTAMRLN